MRFSAIRTPLVFEDGERRDGSAELECLSFDDSSRAMRLVHSMPVFQSTHCVAVVSLQTHITAHGSALECPFTTVNYDAQF